MLHGIVYHHYIDIKTPSLDRIGRDVVDTNVLTQNCDVFNFFFTLYFHLSIDSMP
jgi:hypothetical protein